MQDQKVHHFTHFTHSLTSLTSLIHFSQLTWGSRAAFAADDKVYNTVSQRLLLFFGIWNIPWNILWNIKINNIEYFRKIAPQHETPFFFIRNIAGIFEKNYRVKFSFFGLRIFWNIEYYNFLYNIFFGGILDIHIFCLHNVF